MGMTVAQEVLDVLGGRRPPFLANPEVGNAAESCLERSIPT